MVVHNLKLPYVAYVCMRESLQLKPTISYTPLNLFYYFQATSRTVFHHDSEEFDDNLGAGSDKYLSLAPLLGVAYRHQGVVQYAHTHHGCKRTISLNT